MLGPGGGQIVPGEGSGCDTRLTIENRSQWPGLQLDHRFVKKITGFWRKGEETDQVVFVKKIAVSEKLCKTAPFCRGKRVS